jgi:hypothetical protein
MRQFLCDVGAVWGVAEIWNVPGFWQTSATIIVVILRIYLEWLILKNRKREK